MNHDCILLTGAAGKLASPLRPRLAARCRELRLVDRVPIDALAANETAHVADLAELDRALVEGVDAIVHFAGYPREAEWSTLTPANLLAPIALWEAAKACGVGRIVYASSNHAVGYYERTRRIGSEVAPRPDSRYGVTKVFVEALAAMHAHKHGLRAFGIRIGHCTAAPSDARMLSHWIHPEDLFALIEVGLDADYECEIVYGVSDNARSWYDNTRAEALGYRPRHSADPFIATLDARRSADPVSERYQGGDFAAAGHVADRERARER